MPTYKSSIVSTAVDGDKTVFVWRLGQVRNVSFGECVKSPGVRVGEKSFWQARFFPKGFTDPDWASLYVTSIDCELKGIDGEDPTLITKAAFATVTVQVTPKPRNPEPPEKAKKMDKGELAEDDDDDDGDGSVESASTPKSGSKKGSKASGSKGSGRSGSARSGSARGDAPAAADAPAGPPVVEPIIKELSQMYTNLESSWGFEKMLDIGLLYKWSEGWMNDYGEGKEGNENKNKTQDGYIEFTITVLAVANIRMDKPKNADAVTDKGALRTSWVVHDLKRLCENIGPGKKLSSSVFDNDGDWYLQLYPSGYHMGDDVDESNKYLSLYLHSSPKQVELQKVLKQRFRLGLKKYNPADTDVFNPKGYDGVWFPSKFPVNVLHTAKTGHAKENGGKHHGDPIHKGCKHCNWGSACMCLFDKKNRVFGKRFFCPLSIFEIGRDEFFFYPKIPAEMKEDGTLDIDAVWKPEDDLQAREFVTGEWDKGGAVCFVMEMLVTDEICFQSGLMLHYKPGFGEPMEDKCNDTNEPLSSSNKVVCYECGKGYIRSATTYQARMEEYGYEVGREYILDILMREEEHWLDGLLKTVNVSDKINQVVKGLTKHVANWRIALKDPETGNEDVEEELDDEDEEEDEPDASKPKPEPSQQEKKRMEKEKAAQTQFELTMAEMRKDVEDSHFSKPVCAKCFAARQKLTHPSTKVFFANEPAIWGKMRAYKQADEANKGAKVIKTSKKVISGNLYIETPKQPPSKWECPDQNEITSFGVQSSDKINIQNAAVDMLDYKLAVWDFGVVDNAKAMKKVGEKLAPIIQKTLDPPIPNFPNPDQVVEQLTWCGNFRYNWANKLKLFRQKYEELDGKDGLFKKVSWAGKEAPPEAKHRILTFDARESGERVLEPPVSVTDPESHGYMRNSKKFGNENFAKETTVYQSRWAVLNQNEETNARVAMTLVRGNMWLEPLELSRQCCGRVNKDGIKPEENDDALRDAFCDVRFDTGDKDAVQTHCLWSGKIYCQSCAHPTYKSPLPEFVGRVGTPVPREPGKVPSYIGSVSPDAEGDAFLFTVSYDSKFYRSNTPSGRIQPVSKPPPEPERTKILPLPEEEEDPPDPFEIAGEWLKANIPVCGKTMAKQVDSIKGLLSPDD